MADRKLNIVVWNEGVHEANNHPSTMAEMYPDGMHGAIAAGLREFYPDADITTATLADPEHGLSEEVLARTDVLLWWGHIAHGEVTCWAAWAWWCCTPGTSRRSSPGCWAPPAP
jgi:trehalose utilization protein